MWEELTLRNKEEKFVSPSDTLALKRKDKINRDDLLVLKNKIRSQFDSLIQLSFQPVDFLDCSLTGMVQLRLSLPDEINSLYSPQNPIYDDILSNLCGKVLKFYEEDFVDDSDLLDILSSYFLTRNRFEDYKNIALRYLHNRSLPLKHELFLALLGIHKVSSPFAFSLPDKSNNPLIILFKYKFAEVSFLEKNYLYDLVMTGRYENLLPLALDLVPSQIGVRNAFPIYNRIIANFRQYSVEEKKAFIETYKSTNKYFSIYFLLKTVYPRESVKKWLEEEKEKNGKSNSWETVPVALKKSGAIRSKLKELKQKEKVFLLQPFELLLLLNSTEAFVIRDSLQAAQERFPYSYAVNRSVAILAFFDNEYFQFLHYINRSGRFQYQAEALYVKAVCLFELGKKEEGMVIFQALQKRFPQSEFLNQAIEDYSFEV
ncbi:MAG: tetratricopeptide repeat protein [Spirochaetota bacterium]